MGETMTTRVLLLAFAIVAAVNATDEAGTKWLAENAKKEGVITTKSGLQYKVLRKGSGAHHPTVDSSCECHYEGTLINGDEFDSSYKRGSPTSFAPNQVIKGWTEAMQLMVEGDKFEMYIPSEMAYGESGSPPKIPGGSALIFRMEIIKIKGNKVDAITCDPATGTGCNDKEKAFVEKMKSKDAEALKKELKRLQGMDGSMMEPELQTWLMRRLNALTKMTKEL